MARMRDIKAKARKIRAALLKKFNKMPAGTTITEFAELHGVTRARMSLQIIKAKRDVEEL